LDAPIPAALEAGQQIYGAWVELPESVKAAVMEAIRPRSAHRRIQGGLWQGKTQDSEQPIDRVGQVIHMTEEQLFFLTGKINNRVVNPLLLKTPPVEPPLRAPLLVSPCPAWPLRGGNRQIRITASWID